GVRSRTHGTAQLVGGRAARCLSSTATRRLSFSLLNRRFMSFKIAVLPGDGIGPEIVEQAMRVVSALGIDVTLEQAPVGGAAYDQHGHPLPPSTLELAKSSHAVLFGAVGDWKYDQLAR